MGRGRPICLRKLFRLVREKPAIVFSWLMQRMQMYIPAAAASDAAMKAHVSRRMQWRRYALQF